MRAGRVWGLDQLRASYCLVGESLASPEAYPVPRADRYPSDGAWEREAPPRGLGSFQKIRTEA